MQSDVLNTWGNSYSELLDTVLVNIGIGGRIQHFTKMFIILLSLVIIAVIADFIARKIILVVIERIIRKTKNTWDDVLIEKRVFKNVAHIAPAVLVGILNPILFKGHSLWIDIIDKSAEVYFTVAIMLTFIAFFRAFQYYLESRPFMKDKPLDSYMQLVRIIIYFIGAIYIISVLISKSPIGILSALGAASVVLMLVFKDTILGFVGSIQIAANDMVKVGDWIEFPKFGADGNVIEIKLQTVKVQNWDKTITTIPTYSFVSDAFKNWRGMEESGGRRIKRAINIDLNSVKFLDDQLFEKLNQVEILENYLNKKLSEIKEYNASKKNTHLANIRKLTNIGTLRAYLEAYLEKHPLITKEMTFLVRQLSPTEKGLPIEIYVFSSEQRWAHYEAIQADIFDHLIAILPEFELQVFQNPSGADFKKVVRN